VIQLITYKTEPVVMVTYYYPTVPDHYFLVLCIYLCQNINENTCSPLFVDLPDNYLLLIKENYSHWYRRPESGYRCCNSK